MSAAVFRFNRALLRRPGRSAVRGLRSGGVAPEYGRLLAEHAAYAAALTHAGLACEVLEPDEAHPDSMFVEDPALVFAQGAVLLRPGAAPRLSEISVLDPELRSRFQTVLSLEEGFADGGDVLVLPDDVLIGLSARTNSAGAAALVRALDHLGIASRIVEPPRGALHLKSAATLVAEDTVLTTQEGAASGLFAGLRLVVVGDNERGAANALRVNQSLIVSGQYPRTAEALADAGMDVIEVDTTHVARLDGGLTCMSLRYADPFIEEAVDALESMADPSLQRDPAVL